MGQEKRELIQLQLTKEPLYELSNYVEGIGIALIVQFLKISIYLVVWLYKIYIIVQYYYLQLGHR